MGGDISQEKLQLKEVLRSSCHANQKKDHGAFPSACITRFYIVPSKTS